MSKRSALLFFLLAFCPLWIFAFEKKTPFDVCNNINWATWGNFNGRSATGSVFNGSENVNVTMTSNFDFSSTPDIYNHTRFSTYPSAIPNRTVPRTTWSAGVGGTTEMCFSKTVTNPVLLLASLGASNGTASRLSFSKPYVVLFDGGGMQFHDSYSLTGIEGYAIVMFPGDFDCVTVNSTTPENYTNITWGLRPPPFPINIIEAKGCTEATLTASGGVSYQWNGGLTPNQATNKFTSSGTYIVTVTDANGCKTSASKQVTLSPNFANVTGNTSGCNSVTLTAVGGASYLWNGGDSPNTANNTFRSSGTYSVTVTSADGCTQLINNTVTVNNAPTASIVDNSIACGNTSSLTASGGISYQWSGGLTPNQASNTFTSSGTYSVRVTGANGCTTTLSKTITIGAGQTVINGNDTGCNNVTLTATGGVTYRWDGGNTPNQASNTFTTSGTYNVTITDANGCISTLQKTITVNPNIVPSLNIAASTNNICAGGVIRFTPNYADAGTNPTFKWFKNGVQVSTNETYIANGLKNDDEVHCEITSSTPCSVPFISNKIKVTVNPLPAVSFEGDIIIENDGPKTLNPQANDNIVSYRWFPAIGLDNPNIKNPKANPEYTTEYTLTVSGPGGCLAEASLKVVVLKDIFIPNVFSPNGDGKNDQWVIRNISDYIGTKVQIFNRYGHKVFQNDNFITPWAGIFSGKPLPSGSYYYILDLANKSKTRYTGSVTILR
ncbi:MAG: gliding motility-associated C-terminal domain-containing protein [Pedobacter sp.]|uniref:gliding motility-associated C-terminal domain-containing protein n=1 Tax=Pedobacter sp. TaxID=1411316 RepID=UPI00280806BB|nr:gliding motility-associated C-terminal domain-containing protein [Pedobacter sp.]MDQ8003891.1 gliding motility-associated C-terminal domain-containing protein [Pedobacter sp.]